MTSDALLVTIGEFPASNGVLRALPGATKDGHRVANWLRVHAPGIEVIPLCWPPDPPKPDLKPINRGAVESEITNLLTETSAAMRDRLFVYFSGHGRANIAQPAFPAVYCAQHRRSLPDLFFSLSWIPLLISMPAYREYLFFFDCCNDNQTDQLPPVQIPDVDQRADRPSVLVVTAAQPGEQAIESATGGLFTDVLLEALSGSAGSPDSDVVTAAHLVDYLKEVVPIRAKEIDPTRTQRPKSWFDSDQHADLASYRLFQRATVNVDVSPLLNGHAAADIEVFDFKFQPVSGLTIGAAGGAILDGVLPGQYLLKGRNNGWVQAFKVRTPVDADGNVKPVAEAMQLS